jgi:hypothetical protein
MLIHQRQQAQKPQTNPCHHPNRDHDAIILVTRADAHAPKSTQNKHDEGGADEKVNKNHLEDGEVCVHLGQAGAVCSVDLDLGYHEVVGNKLLVLDQRDEFREVEFQDRGFVLGRDGCNVSGGV